MKPQVHQHLLPFGKTLKDEKKHDGTVDESSSEQQFRKSDTITFVKSGAILLVGVNLSKPHIDGKYGAATMYV